MPKPKPLTKEQIVAAMGVTKSNRSAARYLNCSYTHYKMWAKHYDATEEGYANLFEQHLNQAGKGIKKWIGNHGKTPPLQDLINGIIPATSFSPTKIKKRLFEEGYLKEECSMCGFNERRVSADIAQIEDSVPKFNTSDAIEFELDDYQLERLKELGLHDSPEPDDGSEFISRL